MDIEEMRYVNCSVMEESVKGLMRGFNHEDWKVFSQALDNEMHLCKIEENEKCNIDNCISWYISNPSEEHINKVSSIMIEKFNSLKCHMSPQHMTLFKQRMKNFIDAL